MSRRVVLTMSGKGGVGKTTLARFLGELHRREKTGAVLIDGDPTVGQLVKSLGKRNRDGKLLTVQPLEGVQIFAFHGTERDRDGIADVIGLGDTTLIDLPAASLQYMERLERETGFLGSLGAGLSIVSMITPDEETRRDLADAMVLAEGAVHIAVLNGHYGEDDDWEDWTHSPTRDRLRTLGGIEASIPRLKPRIADRLKKWHVGFLAAHESPHLDVLDRGRLQRWAERAQVELSPAFPALGLPS
ncbi:MAG: hypothetical protein M3Y18_09585 [Candidatus Eremiobacteraeota bacterium]|nr:hypothetical protein [Candidatus Eremiobacteraeota bacterium]